MKNIYLLKSEEDELRHLNQLHIHEIKIKKLKQSLEKMNSVIESVDKVKLLSKVRIHQTSDAFRC